MKNSLTKKTSSLLDFVDQLTRDFWDTKLENSSLSLPRLLADGSSLSFNGFTEVDNHYEMETDLGENAKDTTIEVNIDDCDHILEVTTKFSKEDGNNKSSSESYFSTTLPNDADEDTVNAVLGKNGKLKITVDKLQKLTTVDNNENITVTRNKSKK